MTEYICIALNPPRCDIPGLSAMYPSGFIVSWGMGWAWVIRDE